MEKNITLEDLKNNLIKKLNESIGQLDGLETEIILLNIILQYEKD